MIDPRIKEAFSRVKEDMEAQNTRIQAIEAKLEQISEKLDKVLNEGAQKTPENPEFWGLEAPDAQIRSSTGNQGVQSINQSINNQSITNQAHQIDTIGLKNELNSRFNSLTRQEFLLFLTVYQLEEDLQRGITYDDISKKMTLTESAIRGYTSNLIKKGVPLIKNRLNNRITTLTIDPNFKELGLKQRLFNLFYRQDPAQTSLFGQK